jgi:hypothetical protein
MKNELPCSLRCRYDSTMAPLFGVLSAISLKLAVKCPESVC